jgi:hypothetical protein
MPRSFVLAGSQPWRDAAVPARFNPRVELFILAIVRLTIQAVGQLGSSPVAD